MSNIVLIKTAEPSTPEANQITLWYDTAENKIKTKDEAGSVADLGGGGGGSSNVDYYTLVATGAGVAGISYPASRNSVLLKMSGVNIATGEVETRMVFISSGNGNVSYNSIGVDNTNGTVAFVVATANGANVDLTFTSVGGDANVEYSIENFGKL